MVDLVIDSAFEYDQKAVSHPSYRFSKVIPQNNSTITLGSSILESQIEIPMKAFNLSKSTLDFQMQYVDAGDTTYFNNFLSLGQVYIDSIFVKTREGLDVVSLYNADVVTRAITPYIEKREEFLEFPSNPGALTSALAQGLNQGWNHFKSNALVSTRSLVGNAPPYSGGGQIVVSGATAQDGSDNYQESQYYVQTPISSAGHAGNLYRNFSIPLGKLAPHTLLSLNKTIYLGQAVILTIRWAQTGRIGWATTAAALTGPVALPGVLQIANLQLRLAVEQNQPVVDELVNRVNSVGMSLTIPYIYSYVYSVANAVTQSTHQQRYNRSHGKKLLNVYSFVAATSATANLSCDISNIPAAGLTGVAASGCDKVLTMQPSLNSVNLTEYVLNEYQNDTYEQMKPIIKGSTVGNVGQYQYNRVYIQSWRQGPSCTWIEKDDVSDGLDLDVESMFQIDYSHPSAFGNAAAVREFQVAVVQRTLTINPGGTISLI